jgi:hypothetical protein
VARLKKGRRTGKLTAIMPTNRCTLVDPYTKRFERIQHTVSRMDQMVPTLICETSCRQRTQRSKVATMMKMPCSVLG